MTFRNRKLVHWIAAVSILMSALAPAISQAVVKNANGFAMEVCSTSGSKMIQMQSDDSGKADVKMQACPYCLAHASITPSFESHISVDAPQSYALFPALFYQSPKPLANWVRPPSAAPPAQA
ncbi:DUF2946 domain-containing protein [Polynucleobacter paneuropaeus]|uniref:DUF2946 domain-containing protein n=1 Tax=Polynucleobacter paneuropaeus TaxID=2527775 RepID=A0A9Q2ZV21_9BURK|nr:DUF2946 domain-containing protein [Polynucleobacter paneuropaeus]AWW47634.1 hypothetical protein DPM17_02620 [Polynucleobacter paneuropaeus]MBT8518665.1 DUF2946 domain-containing protein [Polynucleobacter paneuropaeus]MBT8531056.1 DUF2946 domain-containing protein [Polynucleobacter paneuropaeus]MBT8550434.1 DUF2946 domain-containing protein [Polynucleobacter paneuropaeus]MBT8584742.1 DUF2946 domain-containing protein [Polynucleobacter paneuropaeus]